MLSVVAAAGLTLVKLAVGIFTGSLGVLSEALHSTLDLFAAGMTWFAVRFSGKPADKEHNFGHGKMENLSALAESALLLATCAWVLWEACDRLVSGNTEFDLSAWAFGVVVAAIVVDFFRARHLSAVAKKYNSQALEADALHFSTDILSSAVVLVGLAASYFGYHFADSIAAIGVAAIVAAVSLRLARRAIDALLDAVQQAVSEQVESVLRGCEGVERWHDLRVRGCGGDFEIEVNIHVKPTLTIVEAHDISERIEREVRRRLGRGNISVHVEPDGE